MRSIQPLPRVIQSWSMFASIVTKRSGAGIGTSVFGIDIATPAANASSAMAARRQKNAHTIRPAIVVSGLMTPAMRPRM